ncbi:hypothetical protein [Streptosporangium sp. OZ121]|uniref:hypothetical protein n=1 Tax=Streptosporangium sp. OZ121 TaxID=3444183 RepID=UPI003F7A450A
MTDAGIYALDEIRAIALETIGWEDIEPGTLQVHGDDVFSYVDHKGFRVYAEGDRLIAVATRDEN